MEVALSATSEPMDSPPLTAVEAIPSASETMELTSTPSGAAMAAVARKRAEVTRVNFILIEIGLGDELKVCGVCVLVVAQESCVWILKKVTGSGANHSLYPLVHPKFPPIDSNIGV